MPDPKLKEAMAEIKAILKKHDVAAAVTLISETHSEFLYVVDPSWSCAFLTGDGHIKVRAKRTDFKTPEVQKQVVTNTVGMAHQIRDIAAMSFANMEKLIGVFGEHFEIEHEPFKDFRSHREN